MSELSCSIKFETNDAYRFPSLDRDGEGTHSISTYSVRYGHPNDIRIHIRNVPCLSFVHRSVEVSLDLTVEVDDTLRTVKYTIHRFFPASSFDL